MGVEELNGKYLRLIPRLCQRNKGGVEWVWKNLMEISEVNTIVEPKDRTREE